jgi:hypothetical protein
VPMPAWEPPSPQVKHQTPGAPHRSYSHEKRHRRRQSEPVGPEPGKGGRSGTGGTNTPKAGVGPNEEDLELWQVSSPFASLARGMGGGLSQGLRTKEERRMNSRSVALAMPTRK